MFVVPNFMTAPTAALAGMNAVVTPPLLAVYGMQAVTGTDMGESGRKEFASDAELRMCRCAH